LNCIEELRTKKYIYAAMVTSNKTKWTVQKCGDTFTKIKKLTEGHFVPQTV